MQQQDQTASIEKYYTDHVLPKRKLNFNEKKEIYEPLQAAESRYLQNILKEKIMALYPSLTNKDIRTSTVGENGSDIKLLSLTAKKLFRYSAECKNRNENKLLYSTLTCKETLTPPAHFLSLRLIVKSR